MTQQMQSLAEGSQNTKGTTYEDEVRVAQERIARREIGGGRLGSTILHPVEHLLSQFDPVRVLLIHARMMRDLRAWATRSDVGFVDIIAALDHDRDLLVNWVHVKAEGNHKIAEALAPEVLRQVDIRRSTPSRTGGTAARGRTSALRGEYPVSAGRRNTSGLGSKRGTAWTGGEPARRF